MGKEQIGKLLEIFRAVNCKKALVSTGANLFFKPARKMYEGLGFVEIERHLNDIWGFEEISYEKKI